MPGLARSANRPVRERPPSQYIATQPPWARMASAVTKASSSRWPRRTGNTPPWYRIHCSGPLNSCDLAMKRTLRRSDTPRKKWSRNEKWFGATMTCPRPGTLSEAIDRAR